MLWVFDSRRRRKRYFIGHIYKVHSEIISVDSRFLSVLTHKHSIHYMYYNTVYKLMNKQTRQCSNNVEISLDLYCAWLYTERMSGQFRKSPSWCCGLEDTVSGSGKAAPAVVCAVATAGARSLLLSAVQPHCHTLAEDWSQVCRFAVKCVCGCGETSNGLCVALPTFLALMQTLMFRCSQYFLSCQAQTSRLDVIPQAWRSAGNCPHMDQNQSMSVVTSQTKVNLPPAPIPS